MTFDRFPDFDPGSGENPFKTREQGLAVPQSYGPSFPGFDPDTGEFIVTSDMRDFRTENPEGERGGPQWQQWDPLATDPSGEQGGRGFWLDMNFGDLDLDPWTGLPQPKVLRNAITGLPTDYFSVENTFNWEGDTWFHIPSPASYQHPRIMASSGGPAFVDLVYQTVRFHPDRGWVLPLSTQARHPYLKLSPEMLRKAAISFAVILSAGALATYAGAAGAAAGTGEAAFTAGAGEVGAGFATAEVGTVAAAAAPSAVAATAPAATAATAPVVVSAPAATGFTLPSLTTIAKTLAPIALKQLQSSGSPSAPVAPPRQASLAPSAIGFNPYNPQTDPYLTGQPDNTMLYVLGGVGLALLAAITLSQRRG